LAKILYNIYKSLKITIVKKIILFIVLFIISVSLYSQDKSTKYICEQIFVFGNNVTFSGQQIDKYKIAIYGRRSNVYSYLKSNYKNKTIKGKPVEIININKISALDEKFHIVYVDDVSERKVRTIYEKIHKKKVLLITYQAVDENYMMINLLGEGKKFQVQTSNLFDERIYPNEKLVAVGGTKLDLQGLYGKKVDLLKEKEKKLDSLSYLVNQQKLENDKKLSLINQKSSEIQKQQKLLEKQKKSLNFQSAEIKLQKNIIIIVVIFVLIFIILSFIIFRALKINKQKTEQIRQRNEEINQQKNHIEEQANEISKQRDIAILKGNELKEKNKDIEDSIHYALRIQQALLPKLEILENSFKDYFSIYKPKDIVSGDFYWATERGDETIVVASDCTGHGVPGAFMSMLGISFLNQITKDMQEFDAGEILIQLREIIIKSLKQNITESHSSKDGMDMAIIVHNKKSNILQYAGAYNPLYIISDEKPEIITGFDKYRILETEESNNKLYEIKADRMPIGIYYIENKDFITKKVKIKENDQLYMFSDGFPDLYNYEQKSKYHTKRFKNLLLTNSHTSMSEQEKIIEKEYANWLGNGQQIDDIIILAIKI